VGTGKDASSSVEHSLKLVSPDLWLNKAQAKAQQSPLIIIKQMLVNVEVTITI